MIEEFDKICTENTQPKLASMIEICTALTQQMYEEKQQEGEPPVAAVEAEIAAATTEEEQVENPVVAIVNAVNNGEMAVDPNLMPSGPTLPRLAFM